MYTIDIVLPVDVVERYCGRDVYILGLPGSVVVTSYVLSGNLGADPLHFSLLTSWLNDVGRTLGTPFVGVSWDS